MSRRWAPKALTTGRAHALDPRTWSKLALNDVASMPFHAVVFPKVKAVSEMKLGFGIVPISILRRDGHRCQYVSCTRRATTVDHVIPRCQGASARGATGGLLPECNAHKGGRTPQQAGMELKGTIKSQRALLLERFHALTVAAVPLKALA
jgi:hypothetical protein